MNSILTVLGTIFSIFAAIVFSFGTLFCVVYGIYLWGGAGFEFGAAVWNALLTWFKLMIAAVISVVIALGMLATVGKSLFYYWKRKQNV